MYCSVDMTSLRWGLKEQRAIVSSTRPEAARWLQ